MKKIFPYKSLTKNFPGGRRKARVLSPIPHGGSAMLWNHNPDSRAEPYVSQGGMADPIDDPIPIPVGLSNNPYETHI
jgi:hypothetical protein